MWKYLATFKVPQGGCGRQCRNRQGWKVGLAMSREHWQHATNVHWKIYSHSDYGSITLLFQHGIPGLEVQASRTNWISAPCIPDTVLVNIGDQMEFWTGGRFKSTQHRVVFLPEHAQHDRYSIAYFCHANDQVPLDVIPSMVLKNNKINGNQPVKTAGQHLKERLEDTYKFSETAI